MIIGPTVKGRSDLGENGLAVWPRHGSVDCYLTTLIVAERTPPTSSTCDRWGWGALCMLICPPWQGVS